MSALWSFRSRVAPELTRYLTLMQALGRRYTVERDVLRHLDAFLAAAGHDLSADSFTAWCQTQQHLTAGVRRNHMRIVRKFCLYRRRRALACFVPDRSQFPSPHQPIRPYIFTGEEILCLLDAADRLQPTAGAPLRSQTYRLAVALLYTTGLRRGEFLRLRVSDYNPREHTLLVRASKFHKSRVLALSLDGSRELDRYLAARRAQRCPVPSDAPLLWNRYRGGRRYSDGGLAQGLRMLVRAAGIVTPAGNAPRVHDVRHTFAVHALLRWYRAGVDVQAKLPFLAAYMGHVSIVSTQHYLHFVDDIAVAASNRFAKRCQALVTLPDRADGGQP